jgi:hypothetical protein
MRENRPSGSEGGGTEPNRCSRPLSSLNLPPISLSDSLELLDWTGRQLRRVREATQAKRCVTRVTREKSDESSRWGLPTR